MDAVQADFGKVQTAHSAMWSSIFSSLDSLIASLDPSAAPPDIPASDAPADMDLDLPTRVRTSQTSVTSAQRDLHTALTRFSKSIDKATLSPALPHAASPLSNPDFLASHGSPVAPNLTLEQRLIRRAIAQHFLREGAFDLAETLAGESNSVHPRLHTPVDPEPFHEMFAVLEAMRREDLAPAIAWARARRAKAVDAAGGGTDAMSIDKSADVGVDGAEGYSGDGRSGATVRGSARSSPSDVEGEPGTWEVAAVAERNATASAAAALEFRLHSVEFLTLLERKGKMAALEYARNNLSPFILSSPPKSSGKRVPGRPATGGAEQRGGSSGDLLVFQRLMGCLMYEGRLESSPYASLVAPTRFDDLRKDFARDCCRALGMSDDSALEVLVTAGALALPTLIKAARINPPGATKADWQAAGQLPVEIDLGAKFQFHSIFACPVSRDESTKDNPPMILPCGHVLCRNSINRLPRGNMCFKCAYCPSEQSPSDCSRINF